MANLESPGTLGAFFSPPGSVYAWNCNRSDRWLCTRIRCSRVDFPPTASSGETATFLLTARVRRRASGGIGTGTVQRISN